MLKYTCKFMYIRKGITMKKVYRILCLILAMAMIILPGANGVAEAKTFSDVSATGKYSEAIYTLADIGIIKGDAGADTFRPDASISREEFSVIMTRFLAVENIAVNVTTYPFKDVTPDTCADWSIKATKIAYDMGIISGYGDGNFGPKDPVTYEQAVKMIVCALGYENAAIKMGGWPSGYLTVAINNKITSGAEYANSEPAPRKIIAQLIFNALEVNMASDTSTDPNVKRTILSEKLGLSKGKGVIMANGVTSLDASGSGIKEDQIQVKNLSDNTTSVFNAGTSSAAQYLGQQVNYYYKEEAGENVLVSVVPTNTNKSLTFEDKYIKDISATEIQIYDDPDGDTSLYTSYQFDSNVYKVYNEKYYSGALNNTIKPAIGSVTIRNFNNDSKYDVIEVTATRIFVVRAVDTSQKKIYNLYNALDTISTAPSAQRTVTVTKGNTVSSIDAIQKDDVLLISESLNPSGKSTLNIEIIANKVEGKVSASNVSEREFTVAGKTYEAAADYITYATGNGSLINIGDDVVCYLDSNDVILYAKVNETTAVASYSYGYVMGAEVKSTGATAGSANVNLYTASGKEVTYKLSSRVQINGTTYNTPIDAYNALDAANNTITNRDSATGTTDCVQLIKYVLNTNGEISIILTAETASSSVYNANKLTLSRAYNSTGSKYSTSSKMLGTVALDNSTLVFYVPTDRDDTDAYAVKKLDSLNNSTAYKFEAYDSNQGVAKVVIIYGDQGTTVDSSSAPIVVVQQIMNVSDDGDIVDQLTCYYNGETVVYKAIDTSVLAGVNTGDVITLAFDSEGKINNKKLLYSPSTQTVNRTPDNYAYYQGGNNAGTQDAQFMTVYGTVFQAFETNMFVAVDKVVDGSGNLDTTGTIQPVPFSDGAMYYIYNPTNGKLDIGGYADILDYEGTLTGASKVFVYSSYGKTQFVVVCK